MIYERVHKAELHRMIVFAVHLRAFALIQHIYKDKQVLRAQRLDELLPAHAGHHYSVQEQQGLSAAVGLVIDAFALKIECSHITFYL